jgi:neopullulanase
VPSEIDEDEFWQEFRHLVKGINPDAYIVGEIWVDEKHRNALRWLKGDQFDAIMNYGLTSACIGFFIGDALDRSLIKGQGHEPEATLNAWEFAKRLDEMQRRYPPEITYSQYNLLDSHDVPRFLTLAQGDKSILKLAATLMMTYPGAPSIYYGSEIGLVGRRDPDCRRAMPWDESQWDMDLLNHYKKLIHIRKAHPALRSGRYKTFYVNPYKGIYSFIRQSGDEKILVLLNNSNSVYPLEVPIEMEFANSSEFRCLLSGKTYHVENGHLVGEALEPKTGAALRQLPINVDSTIVSLD